MISTGRERLHRGDPQKRSTFCRTCEIPRNVIFWCIDRANRIVPLREGAFGVEVVISEMYPTTVTEFAT
jgi:hypothetical protein